MLVLTRKNRESVIVGHAGTGDQMVKITVLQVRGGNVTLGIEADRSIPIVRSELSERGRAARSACLTDRVSQGNPGDLQNKNCSCDCQVASV